MIPPRVSFKALNSKQQEAYNRAKVAARLADFGFLCLPLSSDWQGADFLAYHIDGHTRRVQLKSRLTIARKYIGKGLSIAFPVDGLWYLVEHDALVDLVRRHAPKWLASNAWTEGKEEYHTPAPSAALLAALRPDRLEVPQ